MTELRYADGHPVRVGDVIKVLFPETETPQKWHVAWILGITIRLDGDTCAVFTVGEMKRALFWRAGGVA